MQTGFAAIPSASRFAITRARIPACLVGGSASADLDGFSTTSILVEEGRIAAMGGDTSGIDAIDLAGGIVFPAFVDMHTHLDKGQIWPRRPNPDGTFFGALNAVSLDRDMHWSARDVAARLDFSLRCAHAHGTAAIRTHLDSIGNQTAISWPVFAEARERWAGRIELQAAALFSIEQVADPAHVSAVRAAVVENGGVLGGVTYMVPGLDEALDTLFRIASDEGLDL